MATESMEFQFNGLPAGECFADLARDATGLEISPTWRLDTGGGAVIQISATYQAEWWSVYVRLATGEARVLHDARTMVGAARALVAADRGCGFPAALEAWDMRCEAESVRALPETLRRDLRDAAVFRLQNRHASFALAAWIDLARYQAARRNKPRKSR